MENKLVTYPIKFKPILKQKVWGGNKLVSSLNKHSKDSQIGESWEVSGVRENLSVISNGKYESNTITDLLIKYKEQFVGKKTYNIFQNKFPLLLKFIDASENLSIQLHPNDELAKERHDSFGKTEMWYVVDADREAKLYAAFNKELDKSSYLKYFNSGKLLDVVREEEVEKGDAFFIEVGTIHAIGKGVLLAEIQQTSDITYRIFDWDRVGLDGEKRELHTELALDAFDFNKNKSCKLQYSKNENEVNKVYSCKYFTTNCLDLKVPYIRKVSELDSFVVYMCLEGKGKVVVEGNEEEIIKGTTVMIPACSGYVRVFPDEKIKLLEVYI